jgi:hypothetical protein
VQEPILVNKREAKRLLGDVSIRTIDYLISNGDLKAVRIGRRVMLRYRDILAFSRVDHPNTPKIAGTRSPAPDSTVKNSNQ